MKATRGEECPGPASFTVLWPAGDDEAFRRRFSERAQSRILLGGWNKGSHYAKAGVRPGDVIYPVQVVRGSVRVLTRLMVAEIENDGVTETVRGALGAKYHLDLFVPPDVLERWRFTSLRGSRPIKFLENGKLLRSNSFQGVYRLDPKTASELFGLILEHEMKQQLPR